MSNFVSAVQFDKGGIVMKSTGIIRKVDELGGWLFLLNLEISLEFLKKTQLKFLSMVLQLY